jgi:GT2 family glycosyltransferase
VDGSLYEVIVSDDSRENNAETFIKTNFPWAKWKEASKKGPAANRNNGASHALHEWLVFIDDDCLPENNLLAEYMHAISRHPDILAFEGSIIPDDWNLLKKDMAECPVNTGGECFWSANICVQKQLFKHIGGFDEQFLMAAQEDQDLYIRLKQQTQVLFLGSCIVKHPVRFNSLRSKLRKLRPQFANWLYYQQKHTHVPARKHLWKAAGDYVKFSVKEGMRLHIRLSILYAFTSVYCLRLVLKNNE